MIDTNVRVRVTGVLTDGEGNIKQKFVKHNLITKAGFDFVSDCMGNATQPKPIQYIAVGTSDTAPTVDDTELKGLVLKKTCAYNHVTGTATFVFSAVFSAGEATGALKEAGILTGDDILFDRVTYPVINKEEVDTYAMTFEVILKEGTAV